MPPIPEGIFEATATFSTPEGDPVTVTTDRNGRFSIDLPPGKYMVEMAASGYRRYKIRRKLVIEPLTDPVWFEDSQVMHHIAMAEGMSDSSARGLYGMTFVGGLSKFSAPRGFWRVSVSHGYY